jgi:hypothetical protein
MNKKPVLIFTVADQNNFGYAVKMLKSLTAFHPAGKDVDILLITNETDKTKLASLPKNIILEDLNTYTKNDPYFFYRQKPIVMEKYLDEYDLVIGLDSDQLVLGDLSYIWNTKDYDIATVLNWNRYDINYYPMVEISRVGIGPMEYFNCGLVASRNKKLIHNWKVWCFSEQFMRSQYKEQDGLNLICYTGNWNVRCLDHGDGVAKMAAWWGMFGKGEWVRAILRDNKIIIPKGLGDTPFPPTDMEIKIAHMGGGGGAKKDNWAAFFSEEVMTRINELTK